jgi:hypothetical protein
MNGRQLAAPHKFGFDDEVGGKLTEGWTDFAPKDGNVH